MCIRDSLCLVPGADLVDHDDLLDPFDEMAACGAKKQFGRGKSVVLKAAADGRAGDKVVGSYGPLPASEYLERYGFLPARGAARRFAATADLRFELDAEDRFIDDKLTVLYENGAIDGDDAESGFFECCVGGEPDLEVLRFLRLSALVGGSSGYPEATPAGRRTIWAEHKEYVEGLLWTLAHDAAIPNLDPSWGLCSDAFEKTGGWPPALYVRAARRLLGDETFTQNTPDEQRAAGGDIGAKSVGVGCYNFDSHTAQPVSYTHLTLPTKA